MFGPLTIPVCIPGANGYTITNAIVLDGVASYLHWTPGVAGNQKTYTRSTWVKKASNGATLRLFGAHDNVSGENYVLFNSSDKVAFAFDASVAINIVGSPVHRGSTGWIHICQSVDTTIPAQKLFINGVEVVLDTNINPSLNAIKHWNNTVQHTIGTAAGTPASYFNGYIAEVIHLDGTYVTDALSFGAFDTNGNWQPIDPSGLPFGANGFWLDFADALNPGTDVSGNANNFTVVSIPTTAQVADSPTDSVALGVGNYCVLDPIRPMLGGTNASAYISNGGLVHQAGGVNPQDVAGTLAIPSSGVFQIECRITLAGTNPRSTWIGFIDVDRGATSSFGVFSRSDTVAATGSVKVLDGVESGAGLYPTWKTVNIDCGMVYDVGADTVSCYINGVLQWTQATVSTYLTGNTILPYIYGGDGTQVTVDFGQKGFNYPIAGATGLSTANFPDPTIPDPSKHFQVAVVAHDGISTSFTLNWDATVNDTLFILKAHNAIEDWYWIDGLRGYNKITRNPATGIETTDANVIAVSGPTVTLGSSLTASGFAIYAFKAGAAGGASNTDGTITSTVSVNSLTNFSIATYTGTGVAATYGHGLPVASEMTVTRHRDATGIMPVWHIGLTAGGKLLDLSSTAIEATDATIFNSADPTATVNSVGTSTATNQSTKLYVAYSWAGVANFSQFGTYQGNASADGSFVNLGMRPATFITKSLAALHHWRLYDNQRDGYNDQNQYLLMQHTTTASITGGEIDLLATGVKMRNATAQNNTADIKVYAAFAEMPVQAQSRGR